MAVNKEHSHQDGWRISDMASRLPDDLIRDTDPTGDDDTTPSSDRIKRLALQKRRDYLNGNEETPMKKTRFRILLVAAIVCLMSVTAFAAFGGLEYIKGIFGDSAASIQNEIVTPQAFASADGRDMALEALVTDGFVTNMVVSLTGARPADEHLFAVATDTSLRSNGWYVLEDFTTKDKTYYVIDLFSEQRFDTADITLSLNSEVAPISLAVTVKNNLGNAVVDFPESAMSGKVQLRELQVSPMGFLLLAHEDDVKGGLPSTHITLLFSDRKTEEIEVEFSPSDETVSGGGGAIIGDPSDVPLVVTFQGSRNPDGELVINGQFSRIINPEKIEKIMVGGVEYPVN